MQAVLILAHKNVDQTIELAQKLRNSFEVYIHYDKKCKLSEKQRESLDHLKIKYYSKFDVKWGSFNIVRATIFLMEKALENKKNTYFHLISGQDWPIKSVNEIYAFFENTNKIYMNYWPALDVKKSGEPEIWWTKYYFNYNTINRRSVFGKFYHRFLLLGQTILRINKLKKYNIKEDQIYAGQEWIDIPRNALEYALNVYKNDRRMYKIFSTSFCSDEIWLQTILCNSKYKSRISKNIHRYIEARKKNGSFPAILDEDDYKKIISSNCFWARKIEFPVSKGLINMLNKDILSNE